jgi:hypothetical protein
MSRRLTIIFAIFAMILANSIAAGNAEAKPSEFSCTGVKIEPASLAQSPMTVKLNLVSARKMTINLGNADIKNTVTNDDQITLHFRTKDFTGEFFHYTNDLFLIYRSGHLAKLTCTPAQ